MHDELTPKLSKWPFFIGDALLLGAAWFICSQSKLPMGPWETACVVACVAGGAWLSVTPFVLEYRALVKLAEAKGLTTVVSTMQNLETLAGQIGGATGLWQGVQEQADKTTTAAKEIAGRMTAEVQSFKDFMQRVNDSERANLRLEVEKLRRAETDWLQVLVRMLDHVYALNQGALRSGQPKLIEQLGHFQGACRDAARRVGLAPFVAGEAEAFDAQRHQLAEGDGKPAEGAVIGETVATGYTFQGRLLRPALVRLRQGNGAEAANASSVADKEAEGQNQLPLDSAPQSGE